MGERLREVLDDLSRHFGFFKQKFYWFMRTLMIER
jgi:hypothetical protein